VHQETVDVHEFVDAPQRRLQHDRSCRFRGEIAIYAEGDSDTRIQHRLSIIDAIADLERPPASP
jgi:hypothetical protein